MGITNEMFTFLIKQPAMKIVTGWAGIGGSPGHFYVAQRERAPYLAQGPTRDKDSNDRWQLQY